jgi:hypothetical protein
MPGMVEEFMQRGLLTESDGAQVFFVAGKEVPLMIRKRCVARGGSRAEPWPYNAVFVPTFLCMHCGYFERVSLLHPHFCPTCIHIRHLGFAPRLSVPNLAPPSLLPLTSLPFPLAPSIHPSAQRRRFHLRHDRHGGAASPAAHGECRLGDLCDGRRPGENWHQRRPQMIFF